MCINNVFTNNLRYFTILTAFVGSVATAIRCFVAAECLVIVVALIVLPILFAKCIIITRWVSMLLTVSLVPAPPGILARLVLCSDAFSTSLP